MTDQLSARLDPATDAATDAPTDAATDAGLAARAPAGPSAPVATPAHTHPATPEAEEVRLVSEGFTDGVELFTWYDGEGRVLAEHTPLDPTLKQCGC
ncbi:hypothetical protein [Quadrisphaera sp. INWT6]|uniref:hypothetical protein n=1 Tax=Quadrisphaera sp. INWT6 TaxID=2596917 RepID=UPI001891FA12|nr:hypothetical protein [Quadrisphaera sp. INWT6]MBF5082285.1 hypothetical protein [Quadrisphaera sp. INWT6]